VSGYFFRFAAALPPLRPPFLAGPLLTAFPRPEPLFFPPPVDLFTVAHARLDASFFETPRFLYPEAIFSAWRFCLLE
jgi:hypothetical protein